MDTNYSYYDINLVDIWQYEQNQFKRDKSSNDLAKRIIEKAEELIIKEGKASFIIDLDNKLSKSYYERNIKDYKKASSTLKGRFETNYFFNKESCYQFDQDIIIEEKSPDFDFWFSLKLRQYQSKLIELNNFLEFQLDAKFNNDSTKFFNFLKLEMKQYQETIFNDRITETVENWVKEKNTVNRKLKGKYSSLRLKVLNSNPNYFQKNSHKLNTVLEQLKDNNFIHDDTLFTDFKRIFEGSIIPESKRITWTGTNKDLHWFMNFLTKESNKVECHKDDKWVIANKCFVDKERKEFGINRLRKANGHNLERKKVLESILAKI